MIVEMTKKFHLSIEFFSFKRNELDFTIVLCFFSSTHLICTSHFQSSISILKRLIKISIKSTRFFIEENSFKIMDWSDIEKSFLLFVHERDMSIVNHAIASFHLCQTSMSMRSFLLIELQILALDQQSDQNLFCSIFSLFMFGTLSGCLVTYWRWW